MTSSGREARTEGVLEEEREPMPVSQCLKASDSYSGVAFRELAQVTRSYPCTCPGGKEAEGAFPWAQEELGAGQLPHSTRGANRFTVKCVSFSKPHLIITLADFMLLSLSASFVYLRNCF